MQNLHFSSKNNDLQSLHLFNGNFFPQNGYGFKTDGGSQYVDLGNWAGDTCFVDVNNCEQGRHFLGSVQSTIQISIF